MVSLTSVVVVSVLAASVIDCLFKSKTIKLVKDALPPKHTALKKNSWFKLQNKFQCILDSFEQVNFQWDNDKVYFVLDQHT
jgi:hypothetical protein